MLPLSNNQIASAFETICSHEGSGGAEIKWGALKKLIVSEGESIAPADLDSFLAALLGGGNVNASLGDGNLFDPRSFADEILGFEL